MSEIDNPLSQYALKRLQQLAAGNGLAPESITLISTEEKVVDLTGILQLTPKAEVASKRGTGRKPPIPAGAKQSNTFNELSQFVAEEQQKFSQTNDWVEEIRADIDPLPGKGWGLENAHIVLDKREPVSGYALEACKVCQGHALLTCDDCLGKTWVPCRVCNESGFELQCYTCFGSGRNPQNKDMLCPTCNGSLRAICRTCQGSGRISCQKCKASGQISCIACEGSGQMFESSTLTFTVDTTFGVKTTIDLPAAVRRAFDRQGLAFMGKGHADIDYSIPEDEQKVGVVKLFYSAKVPCADIVMQFGKERKRIAAFGHKRMLLEIPPFLDDALADGIAALASVGKGKGQLEQPLKLRALSDACKLLLTGEGTPKNLKRMYPYGLSKETMEKILRLMRLALHRTTMLARYAVAITMVLVAGGVGAGLYFTPFHAQFGQTPGLVMEIVLPLLCAILSYVMIAKTAGFKLSKLFPGVQIKSSKHGGMLAILTALTSFILPFGIAFAKQDAAFWLQYLFNHAAH